MAAAMLGSTAVFAADQAELKVQYVAKDKIQATVGASTRSDQATILAFQNGVALKNVASGDIAYIGQDAADDDIGLQISQPAKAVFEFNTAGPASRTSTGKIKIYAAGKVNTLSAEKEVYEMAPISKVAFTDTATGLTLKDNASQEDIRTALSGKTLTVTHAFADDQTDTSPIAIDGTADKNFEYTIKAGASGGNYLEAKYTPADGSKFGVTSGGSLASLEADSPAVTVESSVEYTYSLSGGLTYGIGETVAEDALKNAVAKLITATPSEGFTVDASKVALYDEAGTNPVTFGEAVLAIGGTDAATTLTYTVKYDGKDAGKLTIEIKQRAVTGVTLEASKTDIPLPYGTLKDDIIKELKTGKYVTLTATVSYDSGDPATKDVTASATYGAPEGEGPYTVSVTYGEGGQTSAAVTLNVSISDVASSTITGTVKLKTNPRVPDDSPAVKGAAGILVAAYSKDGTALQGVALTDAAGAYSVTVPSDGEYQLVISYVDLGVEDGKATQAMNYGGVVRAVTVTGGEAAVDGIILTRVAGDADGDGIVDGAADKQEVTTFKGNNYVDSTATN